MSSSAAAAAAAAASPRRGVPRFISTLPPPGGLRTGGRMRTVATVPAERNYVDVTNSKAVAVATIDDTTLSQDPAGALNLCPASRGTAYNGRIGRFINVTALQVRGVVSCPGGGSPGTVHVRVVLYRDKHPRGVSAPQPTNLFRDMGVGHAAVASFRDLDHVQRFDPIKTYTCVIDVPDSGAGTAAGRAVLHPFELYKVWKTPMRIAFTQDSTGGSLSEIEENSIHIMASAHVSSGVPAPTLTYTSRLRFTA